MTPAWLVLFWPTSPSLKIYYLKGRKPENIHLYEARIKELHTWTDKLITKVVADWFSVDLIDSRPVLLWSKVFLTLKMSTLVFCPYSDIRTGAKKEKYTTEVKKKKKRWVLKRCLNTSQAIDSCEMSLIFSVWNSIMKTWKTNGAFFCQHNKESHMLQQFYLFMCCCCCFFYY